MLQIIPTQIDRVQIDLVKRIAFEPHGDRDALGPGVYPYLIVRVVVVVTDKQHRVVAGELFFYARTFKLLIYLVARSLNP